MFTTYFYCCHTYVLYGYVKGLDKQYGKTDMWFAWRPVITDNGLVWLKKVKRTVVCNSDMISYAQYRYETI